VVLCEVICEVKATHSPFYTELSLPNAVTDPMETHVHSLRSALTDSVVGKANGTAVITHYKGGLLGVAHIFQGETFSCGFATIVVQCTVFRGCDDAVQDPASALDGTVDDGSICIVAAVRDAADPGPRIRLREVGSIGVYNEAHVARMVDKLRMWPLVAVL
jgi:hypothetical protein